MLNVGFIKGTKFILPIGDTSPVFCLNGVNCVRVTVSNGGCFVCGAGQLILLDDGSWCSAIDCYNKSIGGHRVDGIELCGKHDTYDIEVNTDDHVYGILVNDIIVKVHNLPISPVSGGGSNSQSYNYYKYIPYKSVRTRVVVRKHKVKKDTSPLDAANLVLLGGVFEEIGGTDETVGGGSQKMGSVVQR